MRVSHPWLAGTLLGGALLAVSELPAAPVVRDAGRVVLTAEIFPLVDDGAALPHAAATLDLDPILPARAVVPFAWPTEGSACRLEIEATGTPGPEGGEHAVTARLVVRLADGRSLASSSTAPIREGTTRIVEGYAERGRRILVALQAERAERLVVGAVARIDHAVRVRLDIARVLGDAVVPLESNLLDTFLGETVEYAFERGAGEDLETMRVGVLPLRIDGDVAVIEVEIDATLPGAPHRVVVSRREKILASRGAPAALSVTAGDPVAGYRFELRADF